jgi:hypothetical protein
LFSCIKEFPFLLEQGKKKFSLTGNKKNGQKVVFYQGKKPEISRKET